MKDSLLLSICIPSFNRKDLLSGLLKQLEELLEAPEMAARVEILIGDNASSDGTDRMVADFSAHTLLPNLRYERRGENIGPDLNFLALFEQARGTYCWLMSDDDLFVPSGFSRVLQILTSTSAPDYLLVNSISMDSSTDPAIKPTFPWLKTTPVSSGKKALEAVGSYITFASILIFQRERLIWENYQQYAGTFLLQSFIYADVVLRNGPGILIGIPCISVRPNNTGGYSFFCVFLDSYFQLLSFCITKGLRKSDATKMLKRHLREMVLRFVVIFKIQRGFGALKLDLRDGFSRVLKLVQKTPQTWPETGQILVALLLPSFAVSVVQRCAVSLRRN